MDPPTVRDAWTEALYGTDGFYRRESPADHFRTSVHASPAYAHAVARLAREREIDTIVDLGAGGGEFLLHVRECDEHVRLVGVELADRPAALPPDIEWRPELPERFDGLLIANEWLDDVPCDVVEVDDTGHARTVHVDPATGHEQLGALVDDPWLVRWWPVDLPGERAEIGTARDAAWADAVARLRSGIAVAVDYGHLRTDRPALGSLRAYAEGHEAELRFDGSRDVTAHVAVDAVADAVGGVLRSQRELLAGLGVDGSRPSLALASADPAGYVRQLSAASEAGELTARGGLGDFWWIVTER